MRYYREFAEFLQKYEEGQEKTQVTLGGNKAIKLAAGDTQSHLKNKLDVLTSELVNPFIHIRNWVKGEMLNLGALISAISEKEACDIRKQNAIKRLADDRDMVHKLSEGKFTFKHMFKSESNKVKQQTIILERINQSERDIENWDTIKRFLVIYIAEIAIPAFKNSKQMKYIKAMQGFSGEELSNANKTKACWGDFFDLTKAFNAEDRQQ